MRAIATIVSAAFGWKEPLAPAGGRLVRVKVETSRQILVAETWHLEALVHK